MATFTESLFMPGVTCRSVRWDRRKLRLRGFKIHRSTAGKWQGRTPTPTPSRPAAPGQSSSPGVSPISTSKSMKGQREGGVTDISPQVVLSWGDRRSPVHCRVSRSLPGLYPLDARNTSPRVMTTKNVPRHRQTPPGAEPHPAEGP